MDPKKLLENWGALGGTIALGLIVFAESGMLIGFFLPGDSLLFAAGLLASQGKLNLFAVCGIAFIGAIVGDQVGYSIGQRVGPSLFKRKNSRIFRQEYVTKSQLFFEKRGNITIVVARFIPIVRTFVPVVAGISAMPRKTFLFFNVLGAAFWAIGVTMLGYVLGKNVPSIDKYLLPIVAVIVLISVIPAIREIKKLARTDPELIDAVLVAETKTPADESI